MMTFFSDFKINRVARYFIYADLILFSGWGLVSPIFSVFVTKQILGATLITVGTGATIYWLTRSIVQVPLGSFLDKSRKDKAPLYTLLGGLIIASLSAFAFIFVRTIPLFYAVQFAHGVGIAFYATAWNGVFSKHLDKNKVSMEWALDSSALGFASGVAGFLGGYIADVFGFSYVFAIAGALSAVAAFVIFLVPDLILPPKTTLNSAEDHTPKTINH